MKDATLFFMLLQLLLVLALVLDPAEFLIKMLIADAAEKTLT